MYSENIAKNFSLIKDEFENDICLSVSESRIDYTLLNPTEEAEDAMLALLNKLTPSLKVVEPTPKDCILKLAATGLYTAHFKHSLLLTEHKENREISMHSLATRVSNTILQSLNQLGNTAQSHEAL